MNDSATKKFQRSHHGIEIPAKNQKLTNQTPSISTPSLAHSTSSPNLAKECKQVERDLISPVGAAAPVENSALSDDKASIPDFTTQTDTYGNASTPTTSPLASDTKEPTLPRPQPLTNSNDPPNERNIHTEENVTNKESAAYRYESLYDSLRMMCQANTTQVHYTACSTPPLAHSTSSSKLAKEGKQAERDLISLVVAAAPLANPVLSDDISQIPDFITQTDEYGNAISPRSSPPADTKEPTLTPPQSLTNGHDPPKEPNSHNLRDATDKESSSKDGDPAATPTANAALSNGKVPIPNFITQTDKYGNASTPRSSSETEKLTQARPQLSTNGNSPPKESNPHNLGHATEKESFSEDGALCKSLYDSFRMMCCCFFVGHPKEDPLVTSNASRDSTNSNGIVPMVPMLLRLSPDDPNRAKLLPSILPEDTGKKCLVLDLDETLVHSSFRPVPDADFVIPVEIEEVVHTVYVLKRPGVDDFLLEMSKNYEIIVYTASLDKYADPVLDLLDIHRVVRTRLFRESCVYYEGNFVKDMSLINRDLTQSIIVDNSRSSYMFHPENAIDCSSYIDDPTDRELDQIGKFLLGIKDIKDVRNQCHPWRSWPNVKIEEIENGDVDDAVLS